MFLSGKVQSVVGVSYDQSKCRMLHNNICNFCDKPDKTKYSSWKPSNKSTPTIYEHSNIPYLSVAKNAQLSKNTPCQTTKKLASTTAYGNWAKCSRMISDDANLLIIMADFKHGLAGGLAGIAVDLVFYPLETIKTRIMGSTAKQNFTAIARSKFKGFSCQMIVSFPYSFTFFYTYETIRYWLPLHPFNNVLASVSAEILANIVRNPFEVVKQQLMVGRSQNITQTLIEIARAKGISGFYTGYKSTIARDIVFSAFQLPIFQLLRQKNYLQLASLPNASLSGAIAALISGFVSCPLDVLKTRLMTQNMKIGATKDIVSQIYKQAGIKGFFKGVSFRCSILCFGGVVYFGALQQARSFFGIQ